MNSRIGLYLGTFDPFHNGHYRIIIRVLEFVEQIIVQPKIEKPGVKKHVERSLQNS